MTHVIKWDQLLRVGTAGKDVSSVVQGLVRTVEHLGPEFPDGRGFCKAVLKDLRSDANTDVLLGCVAMQIVLESEAVGGDVALLADETITSALSSAVSRQSALIAAAAVRSYCSLVVSLPVLGVSEEKQAQLARKCVPSIMKVALAAHPKGVLVQEAVAQGSCSLLAAGSWAIGNTAGTLWSILWPLAVHPRPRVSESAAVALARLTWLSKVPGAAAKTGTTLEALSADIAINSACSELSQLFLIVQQSSEAGASPSGPSATASLAELQSVRLLEMLQKLLLTGRSVVATYGRKERPGMDDSLLLVPIGTILTVVNLVLTSGASSRQGLSNILLETLKLLCVLIDIVGAAILPYTAQLRRWIILLVDDPSATSAQYHTAVCAALVRMMKVCPALLLEQKLVERLLEYGLQAMRRAADGSAAATPIAGVGDKKHRPGRRKRTAEDAFQGNVTAHLAAGHKVPIGSAEEITQRLGASVSMMAQLLDIAAPMVAPPQVAAISEQIVRVAWLGLLAPRALLARSDLETKAMRNCEAACRDASAALAIVNLIEALLQPPRIPVVRLAPQLTDVFISLLDTLVAAHRHRVGSLRRLPLTESASGAAVFTRAAQVKEAVLLLHATAVESLSSSNAFKPTVINIQWPEASSLLLGMTAEPEEADVGDFPALSPVFASPALQAIKVSPKLSPLASAHPSPRAPTPKKEPAPAAPAVGLIAGLPSPKCSPAFTPAPPPVAGGGLFDGLFGGEPAKAQESTPADAPSAAEVGSVATAPQTAAEASKPEVAAGSDVGGSQGFATALVTPASSLEASGGQTQPTPAIDVSTLPAIDLFPEDDGHESPLPALCTDSPDSDA